MYGYDGRKRYQTTMALLCSHSAHPNEPDLGREWIAVQARGIKLAAGLGDRQDGDAGGGGSGGRQRGRPRTVGEEEEQGHSPGVCP